MGAAETVVPPRNWRRNAVGFASYSGCWATRPCRAKSCRKSWRRRANERGLRAPPCGPATADEDRMSSPGCSAQPRARAGAPASRLDGSTPGSPSAGGRRIESQAASGDRAAAQLRLPARARTGQSSAAPPGANIREAQRRLPRDARRRPEPSSRGRTMARPDCVSHGRHSRRRCRCPAAGHQGS